MSLKTFLGMATPDHIVFLVWPSVPYEVRKILNKKIGRAHGWMTEPVSVILATERLE